VTEPETETASTDLVRVERVFGAEGTGMYVAARIMEEQRVEQYRSNPSLYGDPLGNALLVEVAYYDYEPLLSLEIGPVVVRPPAPRHLEDELSLLNDSLFIRGVGEGIAEGIEDYISTRRGPQ
jgi:hypothetical protein